MTGCRLIHGNAFQPQRTDGNIGLITSPKAAIIFPQKNTRFHIICPINFVAKRYFNP